MKGNLLIISPGVLLKNQYTPEYFLDFKLIESRSFITNTIFQEEDDSAIGSGIYFTRYAFYQLGFKLIDIKSHDLYAYKADWIRLSADFIYDKRHWSGCLMPVENNPDFSLQIKLSPEIGISTSKGGKRFSSFGKIGNSKIIGIDTKIQSMAGLLIFNKMLLSARYSINGFFWGDGQLYDNFLGGEISYSDNFDIHPDKYSLRSLGFTIFVAYDHNNFMSSDVSMTENILSCGVRLYRFEPPIPEYSDIK